MADLLRFKDILEMDGIEHPSDSPRKNLSFNDLHDTQYRPGEDELTNYRAYKRKRVSESVDFDEALTMQQRLKRARLFKRLQPRIKIAREKAKRRIASTGKLELRSKKKARDLILKKLTKNVAKTDLTFARRQELEKRLEKPAMKKKIAMIAKRLFPKIRKAEVDKKRQSK